MNAVPELRFPDYMADIPTKSSVGEVTVWKSGGTPSKQNSDFWNGDIPWVSALEMHHPKISGAALNITKEGLTSGSRMAPVGAILLLVRGSMLFKRIPICRNTRPVAFNQDVKCLIPNRKIDSGYLFQWLYYKSYLILSLVTGTGIGAGKLDTNEMQALQLHLPTLPEQQKIAAFLGSVDDKIDALRRKHDGLKQFKAGLMQKLFSQELRFKRDDGSDYPDWEEKRLGDVASFTKGSGLPRSSITEGGSVECVHYGELFTKYGSIIQTVSSRTNEAQGTLSREGDVLMPASDVTPDGLCKASAILRAGTRLGGDIIVIRPRITILGVFLSSFILSRKREVLRLVTGTTVRHLYAKDLKKLVVQIPHVDEQHKTADCLSAVDAKIEAVERQITQMEAFKKGLLQKMFV